MADQKDYSFNVKLAEARGLAQSTMDALESIYVRMDQVISRPRMHFQAPKDAVQAVEALEYAMQVLWEFDLDKTFHRYWFELSGCQCPILDNQERMGTFGKIINSNCPYHGGRKAQTWEDGRFKS